MSEKCITLEDIDHSLGCSGGNAAGIVPKVIYGYHEDVAVWPDEPTPTVAGGVTTPVALEASAALIGDVVMKDGTRAFEFEFTEDVGKFSLNAVGETDGVSFESTLDIIKAKISKKVFGFMNAAAGRKLFFIVTDENGLNYLMGSKRRGCTFVTGSDNATTGAAATERNQTTLQFKFRSAKALVYEGDTEEILLES